jgi:16S rRNA (guanine966-N2)-methyltransferase
MRIIAGEWRGRRIEAPAGSATRPTADRVRETLFSMLVSRIGSFEGLRVADLFAGSGALGFEALSRGASEATFVDSDRTAIDVLRSNGARLDAVERIRVVPGSALSLPPAGPFDLVLADPPYAPGSGNTVVESVMRANWLAPGGWMSVETARGESIEAGDLTIDAQRDVGRARLTLLRRT